MNVIIIGGGGREHALLHALRKNKSIREIYVLPGNGGMEDVATCVPIKSTDIAGIVSFAQQHNIGFAVVAPDDPLVLGAVDALEQNGVRCFGPNARAAIIEGSKAFAKDFMCRHAIPTAEYRVFDEEAQALKYLQTYAKYPVVIKADGLALGKGVIIAQTRSEANEAVCHIMSGRAFGDSGNRVVIEEYLTGPEVSVLTFTDGETIVPMVSSMDHKRAFDGDKGPNTGGMGVIAPNPYYTKDIASSCMEHIFLPTIRGMQAESRPFSGCLYFGLMLTNQGPKVIEYNCRFGDPETQAVLPLLQTDLFTVMQAVADKRLHEIDVRFSGGACCCVVLASGGYPGVYETGKRITINALPKNTAIYHAGTKRGEDGELTTAGGRVMGVTATGVTLQEAIARAYDATTAVSFAGMHMRRDIGQSALRAEEE